MKRQQKGVFRFSHMVKKKNFKQPRPPCYFLFFFFFFISFLVWFLCFYIIFVLLQERCCLALFLVWFFICLHMCIFSSFILIRRLSTSPLPNFRSDTLNERSLLPSPGPKGAERYIFSRGTEEKLLLCKGELLVTNPLELFTKMLLLFMNSWSSWDAPNRTTSYTSPPPPTPQHSVWLGSFSDDGGWRIINDDGTAQEEDGRWRNRSYYTHHLKKIKYYKIIVYIIYLEYWWGKKNKMKLPRRSNNNVQGPGYFFFHHWEFNKM